MFRILIIGNFSGRTTAEQTRPDALVPRGAVRVDRDDLDAAIAAIAPRIRVGLLDGTVEVRPKSMEDFHPDRLLETVAPLRELANLRVAPTAPAAPRSASPSRNAAAAEGLLSGGSLLDQIVAAEPGASYQPQAAPRDEMSEFIRQAVQPHLAPVEGPAAASANAKVDDARRAMLRVILHDRAFQQVEADWRGVELLTRRLDTGEALDLRVVDLGQDALEASLRSDASALAASLGRDVSLVVGLYTFGVGDIETLGRIATLAHAMHAPWIVGGAPSVAGAEHFVNNGDCDDWSADVAEPWQALRRHAHAKWLGVAAPRYLARVPYGRASDPCERLAFKELAEGGVPHESLLWGNPAIICAAVVGEAISVDEDPNHGTVDGLPMYVAREDGVPTAVPCTESLITQRSVMFLLDRGVTPLASQKDGDAIRVSRLQSVASPAAPLSTFEVGR